MRIKQYAYFIVYSDVYDPDQMTAALGVQPDSTERRGSRSAVPLVPVTNMWQLDPTVAGTVDTMIENLVDRLEPLRDQIQALTDNDASSVAMNVVRYFDVPDGVEDDGNYDAPDGSGQHQLVGFILSHELLRRLVALHCPLWFDEYA